MSTLRTCQQWLNANQLQDKKHGFVLCYENSELDRWFPFAFAECLPLRALAPYEVLAFEITTKKEYKRASEDGKAVWVR